ncbi:ABC transporter ATP-binding protein [Bradyrhizobium diversitatis]|uniref:ABC transporter ATP-binding protein n=1 Tax=Bradyrhizobium diversitatis TaxID=2755406 RepID=A0ABS0P5F5_9BRAD|nr:ABC transporter ATP-binding protein [Bradyrhizobium diversitatis]MBH5388292.1 ABC transporter ATP-binding protein [Bradyrhizobium diversitatis]
MNPATKPVDINQPAAHLRLVSDRAGDASGIKLSGVSKTYRTRDGDVPSLRPLDFHINDGEFFVVVGPSGCGKSTLLKLISGLLAPTTGEILVEGQKVTTPHGGMQQRASICRALVHDPRIMLMDEPFGALDALTRERMNVELMRIQRETKKTVLLITHSIPEAVFLADRVLVMTERPGAIAAIYDVPLPRPRSLDAMADPVFTELVQRIRKHFFSQGALD